MEEVSDVLTKTEIINLVSKLSPNKRFWVRIVEDSKPSLNQIYGLIRKNYCPEVPFEEAKLIVKEKLGLFYFMDNGGSEAKYYLSFKELSNDQKIDLIYFLSGNLKNNKDNKDEEG